MTTTNCPKFLGTLIVLALACSVVMASFHSSKRAPSADNRAMTCQQKCLGGGAARMSRCLRFECRKRVFRYYMRIGKRRNEDEAMGGTNPNESVDILQTGYPGLNGRGDEEEEDEDFQLQHQQQQAHHHQQQLINQREQQQDNPLYNQDVDDEDAVLMPNVVQEIMGLSQAERRQLEHKLLSRLLGRKAYYLLQRTPSIQDVKEIFLRSICNSDRDTKSYFHDLNLDKLCKSRGLAKQPVRDVDPTYEDSFEELFMN